jgi:hypothetical protein
MTITTEAIVEPLTAAHPQFNIVEPDGRFTEHGIKLLQEWHEFISGMSRVVPCSISFTSAVATLTPAASASKLIKKYNAFDIFAVVPDESYGAGPDLTAFVQTDSGALATLPVYLDTGVAATSGDVNADSLYLFVYCDRPQSGSGGCFILK